MERGRSLQPPVDSKAGSARTGGFVSSSRSPPGLASENLDVPRKRSQTLHMPPPNAEVDLTRYNIERLKKGMDYARDRMKSSTRRVSPIQRQILSLYAGSCESMIHTLEMKSRDDGYGELVSRTAKLVQGIEKDLVKESWIKACKTEQEQVLQDELLELRRLAYYARYGDWAMAKCHKLRLQSKGIRYEGGMAASKLWTEIAKDIDNEWGTWEAKGSSDPGEVKTIHLVWHIANKCGLNFDNSIQAIRSYANRNKMVYNDLLEMLRDERYHDIRMKLFEDLRDLPCVLPPGDAKELIFMEALLRRQIHEWFDVRNPEKPQTWVQKPGLESYAQVLITAGAKAKENIEKHEADLAARAAKDIAEAKMKEELFQQAAAVPHKDTLPKGGEYFKSTKRKASQAGLDNIQDKEDAKRFLFKLQERAFEARRHAIEMRGKRDENRKELEQAVKRQGELDKSFENQFRRVTSITSEVNRQAEIFYERWPDDADAPRRTFSLPSKPSGE